MNIRQAKKILTCPFDGQIVPGRRRHAHRVYVRSLRRGQKAAARGEQRRWWKWTSIHPQAWRRERKRSPRNTRPIAATRQQIAQPQLLHRVSRPK